MKKYIILIILFFLISCAWRTEYSEMKSEKAKVIMRVYQPQTSHTDLESTEQLGYDGNLHTVWYPVCHTVPEYYGVQFICDNHCRTFEFSSKSLYERVREGEIVTLKYVDEIKIHKKTGEEKIVNHHTLRIIFENGDEILRHVDEPRFKKYYTANEVSLLMKSLTNK